MVPLENLYDTKYALPPRLPPPILGPYNLTFDQVVTTLAQNPNFLNQLTLPPLSYEPLRVDPPNPERGEDILPIRWEAVPPNEQRFFHHLEAYKIPPEIVQRKNIYRFITKSLPMLKFLKNKAGQNMNAILASSVNSWFRYPEFLAELTDSDLIRFYILLSMSALDTSWQRNMPPQ